jgi:cellulose synthase/poly-beta-1,6-N-acetylglucosamine synthase-like glycosyltransferase
MLVYCALIFTALLLFYVGYLLRCAFYFGRMRADESIENELSAFPRVTVIVPARNEAAHIRACVQAILAQDYPAECLQLIVVNDHSEDDTVALALEAFRELNAKAQRFAKSLAKGGDGNADSGILAAEIDGSATSLTNASALPAFQIIDLPAQSGSAYKKAAVAQAIAQATGDIIVTTDADCHMGPQWLRAMIAQFDPETALVSGPVVLESSSIFGQFQALEFMGLIAVGAAGIAAKQPTMCNGANLAYRKSVFEEVGGFAGIDHIASGDDELLMHKIAALGRYRIRFARARAAIVHTQAQENWAAFKRQRIRWVSKSTHYKNKRITSTLVLSYLAMVGFPLLLVGGYWDARLWGMLGVHLLLKMLAELAVLWQAAVFFDKLRLLFWLPLEQVAHIAYVLWVGIAGNRKSYEWKGRNVK